VACRLIVDRSGCGGAITARAGYNGRHAFCKAIDRDELVEG
jgi:hypothetical protein